VLIQEKSQSFPQIQFHAKSIMMMKLFFSAAVALLSLSGLAEASSGKKSGKKAMGKKPHGLAGLVLTLKEHFDSADKVPAAGDKDGKLGLCEQTADSRDSQLLGAVCVLLS
jgi:hypothetical protein